MRRRALEHIPEVKDYRLEISDDQILASQGQQEVSAEKDADGWDDFTKRFFGDDNKAFSSSGASSTARFVA